MSSRVREWSAIAWATTGCASWSSAARPPPRKMTASRLSAQTREPGPKMPARGSRTRVRSRASAPSRSARDTVTTPGVAHAGAARASPRGGCRRHARALRWPAWLPARCASARRTPDELPELQRVEREAGERFRGLGLLDHLLDHSLSLPELAAHQRAGRVWVAADPDERPVGFAVASVVDGGAHLEELDVVPEAGRRGIGSRLVATVCDWAADAGFRTITLSTFRDVPWNAPFYARRGFRPLRLTELSPALREVRAREERLGIAMDRRVVMQRDLRRRDRVPPLHLVLYDGECGVCSRDRPLAPRHRPARAAPLRAAARRHGQRAAAALARPPDRSRQHHLRRPLERGRACLLALGGVLPASAACWAARGAQWPRWRGCPARSPTPRTMRSPAAATCSAPPTPPARCPRPPSAPASCRSARVCVVAGATLDSPPRERPALLPSHRRRGRRLHRRLARAPARCC